MAAKVGDTCWYYPRIYHEIEPGWHCNICVERLSEPCIATIAYVHDDGSLNLSVIDHAGYAVSCRSVMVGPNHDRSVSYAILEEHDEAQRNAQASPPGLP